MLDFVTQMMEAPGPGDFLGDDRKAKVLSFVEKDIFVVNNYESVPFKNKNHAIECLIPYHIFQVMADDVKFKGSDVEVDLRVGLGVLRRKVIELYEETVFRNECFTPQLLLYHEQRYINTLMQQRMQSAGNASKKATAALKKIRIKRSKKLYVFGPMERLRMRLAPSED